MRNLGLPGGVALGLVAVALLCRVATRPAAPHTTRAALPTVARGFTDVAAQAGLTFRYNNAAKGMSTISEQAGSGCAWIDYDGDGWPDLYLLNGRDLYGRGIKLRNALYHNNHDGTFTDVTDKAGVPGTGYGLGVVIGDYDNDGRPDIFICQWGKNCLYHNNGDGTFTDVTDKAGVGGMDYGEPFHTGCAWIDYDRDGRLDLFVSGYVRYRPDGQRYCKVDADLYSNCPPSAYDGTPSILYHNNGDGTFTNVTKKAGVYLTNYKTNGKALSVLTCDVDDDGWPDLIVGNDGTENRLLHNNRNGTFTNVAASAGVAFAQDGASIAAMGLDVGDYLNEGRPGLFIADWSKRPDHLWRNQGGGVFLEVSAPSHVGDIGFPYLGFGAGFLDYDNDGWLDLFIANGHVYPEVDHSASDERYLQAAQLMHNQHDGTFTEVTATAGSAFRLKHAGRGVAFGDYDNDGNIDILINNNDGPPVLMHNGGGWGGHRVTFRLIGTKSNRDAIGAKVRLTAGGLHLRRDRTSGGSYLSSGDPRLHFGLGGATTVDSVEVEWPSGLRQRYGPLPADVIYTLREGAAQPEATPYAATR
jgi:hypothetical protein